MGVVWMVAILPAGAGWMLAGFSDTGLRLQLTRLATLALGGVLTFLFSNATAGWVVVVFIVALAPAAVHVLVVPPISALVLRRGLKST